MATGTDTTDPLAQTGGTRFRRLRGLVFEAGLLAATLVGLLSLLVLFGYIAFDAFRPLTASARWYMLYFATLVAPTAGFTLYARRRPAVRAANARAFAAVAGGLTLALVIYVVAEAVSPYDVFVYVVFVAGPAVALAAYGRRYGRETVVRPAIPVAAVGGIVAVLGLAPAIRFVLGPVLAPAGPLPATPVVYAVGVGLSVAAGAVLSRDLGPTRRVGTLVGAAALGGVLTAGLYDSVRPVVGVAAEWVVYLGFVTVPATGLVYVASRRRFSESLGRRVAAATLGLALATVGGSFALGTDPSLPLVLYSLFLVPVGYVVVTTLLTDEAGRTGVLGPFVLGGGVLLGATLERALGVDGLEAFLTPTLLVNSWDGLNAANAGVYPQIVGSIVIVGVMMVLAFPVGVGAAVYLEEYAPESGLGGRLATVLEVNISNLAGVPSVVYGLLGLALFRNSLGFGTGVVVSAAGTLGLLILPIVVVSAQEAIRSVPDSLRQASYGMGASRWQTLREVVFPEAVPGILTGTILALARAIGETAPLVIIAVATTTYTPPSGLFGSATALPLQIFAARSNVDPAFRHGIVPATAVVLLVLMLVMNATAVVVRNRYDRDT